MDTVIEPDSLTCLKYRCPHCGEVDVDAYEVLSTNEQRMLACDGCRNRYCVVLLECPVCGEETTPTWATVPTRNQLLKLTCARCNHSLIEDEIELRSMG